MFKSSYIENFIRHRTRIHHPRRWYTGVYYHTPVVYNYPILSYTDEVIDPITRFTEFLSKYASLIIITYNNTSVKHVSSEAILLPFTNIVKTKIINMMNALPNISFKKIELYDNENKLIYKYTY